MYSRVHWACTLRCRTMYFEVPECVLPRPLGMYFQVHRRDRNRPTPSVVPSPPTIRRPSRAPLVSPTERGGRMSRAGLPSTAYGRLPRGAPQRGQVPGDGRVPSPVTPNPARTTRPRAAVRLTPRWSANSPSCFQSTSSSRTWVSCRSIGILGRAITGKCKGTALAYDYPSTSRCGTLPG